MSQESIVEINGHLYRYRYNDDTQKTDYIGPVGDAPGITEEEFNVVILTMGGGLKLQELGIEIPADQLRMTWKPKDYERALEMESRQAVWKLARGDFKVGLDDTDRDFTRHVGEEILDEVKSNWRILPVPERPTVRDVTTLLLSENFQNDVFSIVSLRHRDLYDELGMNLDDVRKVIRAQTEHAALSISDEEYMVNVHEV